MNRFAILVTGLCRSRVRTTEACRNYEITNRQEGIEAAAIPSIHVSGTPVRAVLPDVQKIIHNLGRLRTDR